jgi:uncharacterized protein YcbX
MPAPMGTGSVCAFHEGNYSEINSVLRPQLGITNSAIPVLFRYGAFHYNHKPARDKMNNAKITEIFRYPVKGLTGEALASTKLSTGGCIAGDRGWAIEAGTGKFDTINPRYFPKANFLMLMRDERLAALECRFDESTGNLAILRDGKQVSRGNLNQKIGRQLLEQFFAAYLPETSRGAPKFLSAVNWSFSDVPEKVVSIINLATVRDIERVVGVPVDPARFRGNILIDGIEPWAEFNWVSKTLLINGKPLLEATGRIQRCAAINVNPQSAIRDLTIPRTLSDVFGHEDCGIYAKAIDNGKISSGDAISLNA